MFYAKNVPSIERAIRVLMGLALAAFGLFALSDPTLGYILAASGAMMALTGFVGFCPMCAMLGRKLGNS